MQQPTEPLILDTGRLLLDHHGRLAAMEVETRETRADVAGLASALTGISDHLHRQDLAAQTSMADLKAANHEAIAGLAAKVEPLVAAAAGRYEQDGKLLEHVLTIAAAVLTAGLAAVVTGATGLNWELRALVLAGTTIVAVLAARLLIAHNRQPHP